MKIEDGTGSSRQARVTDDNQLSVAAITEPQDKFQNRIGNTWSVTQSTTPVGANDYIFYFKNTSSSITYVITDVRATAAAATLLSIDYVEGSPTYTAASDLTPVPRNLGISTLISSTIKEDTDITGLTDNGRLFPLQVESANKLSHLRTSSNIIIPPGQAVAMASSAVTAVESTWSISVLEDL